MEILDIFKGDGFSMTSLTNMINETPFVPGQAGNFMIRGTKKMLFSGEGVRTTTVAIENYKGTLTIIPNTPRGGPSNHSHKIPANLRYFVIPHFPMDDQITSEEMQNLRSYEVGQTLVNLTDETARRMVRLVNSHDTTVEYGRIGALQGVVYDSDGASVIYNYFNEYGITQLTEDFNLGNATENVLGHCTNVRSYIQNALGGAGGDGIDVFAFVGQSFWNEFVSHPVVREAYKYYEKNPPEYDPLTQDLRYKSFKYGSIYFSVYRGTVNGIPFVPVLQGTAFPLDIPELFLTKFAPADYLETVNTIGLPRYAKMAPDPSGLNKFVTLDTQSNPLSLCTRPATLIKLITST